VRAVAPANRQLGWYALRYELIKKICGCGFGWGNGRGLVGCDGISHHIPIAFSFPEILHATGVSTNTVLIQSLMRLSRNKVGIIVQYTTPPYISDM